MTSETVVQQRARLTLCELGGQAWRNNTGAYQDETGRWVRYGLCNESKEENAHIKSSDIIGITPTLITANMVGYYLGVFTALEIKKSGWHQVPSDKRAAAQAKFHQIVRDACGYAGFVTHPDDVLRIVRRG